MRSASTPSLSRSSAPVTDRPSMAMAPPVDLDRADARQRGFRPERDAAANRQRVIQPLDLGAHRFRTRRPASAPISRPSESDPAATATISARANRVAARQAGVRDGLIIAKTPLPQNQANAAARTARRRRRAAAGRRRQAHRVSRANGPTARPTVATMVQASAPLLMEAASHRPPFKRELEQTDQTADRRGHQDEPAGNGRDQRHDPMPAQRNARLGGLVIACQPIFTLLRHPSPQVARTRRIRLRPARRSSIVLACMSGTCEE